MPRIPSITTRATDVPKLTAPTTVPMENKTGETLVGLGRGLMDLGTGMQRTGEYLQQQIDDSAVLSMDNDFAEATRRIVPAFRSLRNNAAVQGYDAAVEELDRAQDAIMARAQNSQQAEDVQRMILRRRQAALESLDVHRLREAEADTVLNAQVRFQGAINDARTADDSERAFRIGLALQAGDDLTTVMGQDPKSDVGKARRLEATSAIHAGVVEDYARTNAPAAERYLQSVPQDEILPATRAQLLRVVESGSISAQSALLARELTREPEPTVVGIDSAVGPRLSASEVFFAREQARQRRIAEAFAKLDSMPDLDERVRDETKRRIEVEENRLQRVQADYVTSVLSEGQAWLNANRGKRAIDNPTLFERADAVGLVPALDKFAVDQGQQTVNEAKFWEAYLDEEGLRRKSPAQIVAEYSEYLGVTDLRRVLEHQARLLTPAKAETVLSPTDHLIEAAREVGMLSRRGGRSEELFRRSKEFYDMQKHAEARAQAFGISIRQAIDEMLLDTVRVGGTETHRWRLNKDQQEEAYVDVMVAGTRKQVRLASIPGEVENFIAAQLRAVNIQPTPTAIAEEWVRTREPKKLTPEALQWLKSRSR